MVVGSKLELRKEEKVLKAVVCGAYGYVEGGSEAGISERWSDPLSQHIFPVRRLVRRPSNIL